MSQARTAPTEEPKQTRELEITVSVPEEVLRRAEHRCESFLDANPEANADVEEFLIEHFDWEWRTEVPDYWNLGIEERSAPQLNPDR